MFASSDFAPFAATPFDEAVPAAPRQHCGIETRAWCLRAGLDPVSMVTEDEFRIWKIHVTDADASVTVKESKNCDAVLGDVNGETRVATTDERMALITFHIPQYACAVEVSWSPATVQTERIRTSVLTNIWVGAGEKVPLYKIVPEHLSR